MPAGTNPIYINRPRVGFSNTITAANITKDLSTGTLNPTLFQANTINGSYLDHIRAKPLGACTQSAARFFLHNGLVGGTGRANNNAMFAEITLPTTVATENVAQPEIILPVKLALPAGWNVHVTLATAVSGGWTFGAFGGDY